MQVDGPLERRDEDALHELTVCWVWKKGGMGGKKVRAGGAEEKVALYIASSHSYNFLKRDLARRAMC